MVESEVGKGSTFTLYLPRVFADERPQPVPVEEAAAAGGRGMAGLVVEDNIEVGTLAADALTELGYAGTPSGNATQAPAERNGNAGNFCLALTDVVVPGLTRIDLR